MSFVPVNEPILTGNEKKYLAECIDSGWISSEGPFVARLEQSLAERVGRKHGIAVCNGSAALEVALAALGVGRGDEVILPSFTIISCAAAVIRTGATPIVVDADPLTWNLDPNEIETKITARTKALMPVHTYGLPVDMDPVLSMGRKHQLLVIEDAAEVIGQTYRGKMCGSFGDISAFSFYPNKHVTTGEGGMLLTDSDEVAGKCRGLRNLCFGKERRFVHESLGWNFRMSNLQAAIGVAQVERLAETVRRKREIGARYQAVLSSCCLLDLPLPSTNFAENIYWVFGVVLRDEVPFDAEEAMAKLQKLGVGTRPFFWPMHQQPVFRRMGLFESESCPHAERLARRGFYLPSGAALTNDQIDHCAAALLQVLA
jgi:perosamine synthetase